jgi:hypothetical protein
VEEAEVEVEEEVVEVEEVVVVEEVEVVEVVEVEVEVARVAQSAARGRRHSGWNC